MGQNLVAPCHGSCPATDHTITVSGTLDNYMVAATAGFVLLSFLYSAHRHRGWSRSEAAGVCLITALAAWAMIYTLAL
jgi:hypothetical protein